MTAWLLFVLAYVLAPYYFLDFTAERRMDGKWHWPFPTYFVILTFIFWPILVPWATSRNRRAQLKGKT